VLKITASLARTPFRLEIDSAARSRPSGFAEPAENCRPSGVKCVVFALLVYEGAAEVDPPDASFRD
jgi:hypothetical protein